MKTNRSLLIIWHHLFNLAIFLNPSQLVNDIECNCLPPSASSNHLQAKISLEILPDGMGAKRIIDNTGCLLLHNQSPQTRGLKQHTFIILQFLQVRSVDTLNLVLCFISHQAAIQGNLGCNLIRDLLNWENTHFQAPSGCWQNSSPEIVELRFPFSG